MPYVNLPPGCSRLKFADGGRPAVADKPGGKVFVSDARAKMIDSMSGNGTAGLVTGQHREYGAGGAGGRICSCSATIYYEWTKTCPKCGRETVPV